MRIGVIGCGQMGKNHLRIISQMRDIELTGLVEPDNAIANSLATQYGCTAFDSVEDLAAHVDAVTIASPSITHASIGQAMLGRGIHCLIEKPMATTEADCLALIAEMEKSGALLMVGHIERYNPVIEQLGSILSTRQRVVALDARRMSSSSSRITDVDVVMDLMVHDLDVALGLIGSKPVHVLAQGIRGEEGSHDYVNSLVRFECGSIGSFTASRITENKVRELQVTTDVASIQADYTRQELFVYQQSKLAPLGQESGGYVLDLTVDRVMVRHAEPLVREIEHFANCVRQKRTPLTDANSTLEVMRLAWWIQDKLEENDEAKS